MQRDDVIIDVMTVLYAVLTTTSKHRSTGYNQHSSIYCVRPYRASSSCVD